MAKLKCRSCGGDVDSDEKTRKCRHCNELFPFACAVCDKHLRPPIPAYPVERYYNEAGDTLCTDHYQRECPECKKWFRADENPGFFLCSDCTHLRAIGAQPVNHAVDDVTVDAVNLEADKDGYDEVGEHREVAEVAPTAGAKAGGCLGVLVLMLGATATPFAWLYARVLWA